MVRTVVMMLPTWFCDLTVFYLLSHSFHKVSNEEDPYFFKEKFSCLR